MASESVLQSLLERHREVDRVRYSVRENHAPMVLIALHRLGASEDDLEDYYSSLQIQKQETDPESPSIDTENWSRHIGELSAASGYCRFFESEIERLGFEETLRTYLPKLMPGVAAHAFHPLLRIGYGIDLGDEKEIAFGLGYWAATFLPSPDIPMESECIDPRELLENLANIPTLRALQPSSRSIANRIGKFYSHEDFRKALRPLRFDAENPLEEISEIVADAFVEYHHFAMLHGVTSCHALRNVLPHCGDPQRIVNDYVCAVFATYLSVVNLSGDMNRPLPECELEWPVVRKRAIETGVEHTIKFAYTAERESVAYGRDVYRLMAMREIENAAPFF